MRHADARLGLDLTRLKACGVSLEGVKEGFGGDGGFREGRL